MSDYVKRQLATALRTLPWYVGIPAVLLGSVLLALRLLDPEPNAYVYWRLIEGAMLTGFVVWSLRQAVRLLWTIRMATVSRSIVSR